LQPCVGLVDQIELGELGSPEILAMLQRYVAPLLDQGADTIVLGCTHYPLVRASIESAIAEATDQPVTLVDTGDAVARQLTRLLTQGGLLRAEGAPATLEGYTSASATALASAFANLVGLTPPVAEVSFPVPAAAAFATPA
jgi:glutamate racemase